VFYKSLPLSALHETESDMFIRYRKTKSGTYVYREHRWREGKKVRSKSDYLGKLNDWLDANFKAEPTGMYGAEKNAA
jgi:hypothetical protein